MAIRNASSRTLDFTKESSGEISTFFAPDCVVIG